MKRSRNFWMTLAAVALVLLGIIRIEILIRWNIDPIVAANISTMRRHLLTYKDDVDFVAKNQDFKTAMTGRADAGSVLNPLVTWQPAVEGMKNPASKPLLASKTREELLRFGDRWIHHYSRVEKMRVDLSLFTKIQDFDYWDIEKGSPIATLIQQKRFIPPAGLPTPDATDLIALCKIRLMAAVDEDDQLPALNQVRKLAKLLITTENTQLVTGGFAILENETAAYKYYVKEKLIHENSWTPVNSALLKRATRALYATRGYLHIWTPEDLLQSIFVSPPTVPVGYCAAMNEALPIELSLRPYLKTHLVLERRYDKEYATLDKIIARARRECRLSYVGRLIDGGSYLAVLPGPTLLAIMPYWRKLFALRASAVNFTGFDLYNRLLAVGQMQTATSNDEN